MIGLYVVIAIAFLLVLGIPLAFMLWKAPTGWEDERGFHRGVK